MDNTTFKIGDRLKAKEGLIAGNSYDGVTLLDDMHEFITSTNELVITNVSIDGIGSLTLQGSAYGYPTRIFELAEPKPEPRAIQAMPISTLPVKQTRRKNKGMISYGTIELEILNHTQQVPTESLDITLPTGDKKTLGIAVKYNLPALLVGETGTGKTSVIKQIAHLRKQNFVRVNMTGFTTPDELIGSKSVKDGETYFEHGIITNAMVNGAILVLDEVNATTPDCLFILHGLLDDDRRVTLPNGEVIKPHKDFRVFATCNPDYEGTKSMNKAFLDRFPIIIAVDTLTPSKEKALLVTRTGVTPEFAEAMVTVATMARKDYAESKISTFISTRSLINTCKLIASGLEPRTAYETTIVKKTNNRDEQKALGDFFLSVFKMAEGRPIDDMPVITTRRELKTLRSQTEEYMKLYSERGVVMSRLEVDRAKALTELQEALEANKTQSDVITEYEKQLTETREQVIAYKQLDSIIKKVAKGQKAITAMQDEVIKIVTDETNTSKSQEIAT